MMKISKVKRIPALISTLCFLVIICLIPAAYAAKGAGTENRDWVDGGKNPSVSQPLYEISETEIRIAMRDGIELQAFLYFPVLPDDAGAIPAVVCATGYGVEGIFKIIFEPDMDKSSGSAYLKLENQTLSIESELFDIAFCR